MFDRIFLVMKMKKLLLCILSLMLCLNTSVIHAQEPASLMIVAHPDDETIWGGSQFNQWKLHGFMYYEWKQ